MWQLNISGMAEGPLTVRKDHLPTLLHLVDVALQSPDVKTITLHRVQRTAKEASEAWAKNVGSAAKRFKEKLSEM